MYESWYDVAVLQIKVVVRSVDVGRDDTGEHTLMLLVVCPGYDINIARQVNSELEISRFIL